jgi:glycine betaine/choline ABC-type transport system substrate-binding protein
VPIANTASLALHPGIAAALAGLAGRLDETVMRRLNLAVDGAHRPPAAVAREFLQASGLSAR